MAKGGGSWKVAYADFVTAMMAFFLVMWIGAQDVKVRQSVANYFVDPNGVSKKATNQGAIMEAPDSGPVPANTANGGKRGSRAAGGPEPSPATDAVINWVHADDKRYRQWKAEARRCREAAHAQKAVNETRTPEEIAAHQLALLIQAEVTKGVPTDLPGVYQDILKTTFDEVNWDQVARDVIAE